MINRRFFQAIICFCLVLFFSIPHGYVHAQDLNSIEAPLDAFHDGKPVQLLGLISSQTLNINIPRNWLIGEENWLDINIRISPTLDLARSSLTISLNGLQVNSYSLTEITASNQRILIPADMFTQGNNTLTFTGALYLPSDQETKCQNWDDPARWLSIEPGGFLHLSFVTRDPSIDLAYFPQVFIEPLEKYLPEEVKTRTLIVLPDDSTEDDLTAVSTLSYILGANAETNYGWEPEIIPVSQLDANITANRNVIFIGQSPKEFQDSVDNNKNYVALFPSPWSVGNAVMIIGDQNRQDGFSPASVFSDPVKSVLLHGNVAYIDRFVPPTPQPFQNNYSFEELGYPDRTVRGIGQENLTYRLYIPYNIDPSLVKLNLNLAHSPDLDLQNSSFTVYLNGFSVAGILPTARSAAGTSIPVELPASKFRPGVNFIRIMFDLHVPYSSCERAPESVWATILNTSTLEITYAIRQPIPSLINFPLPFNDYPGSIMIIPDHYNQMDLERASQLSFVIGTSNHQFNSPPGLIRASHFALENINNQNIILMGLPSENPVIMKINDLLPQPFTQDGKSLQDGYGIYLPTSNKDASVGLMQIIPSPWSPSGTILTLTGNDQEGLDWTWDIILNPDLQNQFSGNIMVVGFANRSNASDIVPGAEGQPQAIFQQSAEASNIPIIGPLLQKYGQTFIVPITIAIGTALLLVICILWVLGTARKAQTAIENKKEDRGEDE